MDSSAGTYTIVFYILIFAIMYFFFLRPNVKKRKEAMAFSDNINKGDEVVTASGIIGRVNKIEGNVIHLQVDQKTYIKMLRSAISKEMTEQYQTRATEEVSA